MSPIAHIEYDDTTKILTVVFADGNFYTERDVQTRKEAAIIVRERFGEKKEESPKPLQLVKNCGHLTLC